MLFYQLSQQFVHVQSSCINISVSLAFIVLIPLSVALIFRKLYAGKTFAAETNDILNSWGLVFVIMASHMLLLFLLLKNYYGYGYEQLYQRVG